MALPADLHAHWDRLSELLDEALTLPVEQRAAFVDSLGGEQAALRDTLRELLAKGAGVETAEFLATLPRFTGTSTRGPLAELTAGDLIGPYRLDRELGTGGMGSVWLAERADGSLKRKVALKLPRLAWVKGLAERMARERDILASLEHPRIARLYDAGLDQMGRPYLALEYVEGQPIDVYAKERGLSVRRMLELLLQVCEAVAFAHSRLVVHRDLKPSNILVTADGQVRLLDFGIAKLMEGDATRETQLTQLAGRALTLDYASPEQIKGEPIGTASDVYSLGVVTYELLTGARPYKLKRGSSAELEEAIATVDAAKASESAVDVQAKKALRGDLDAILNKALKKQAVDRYATVDALAQDLNRHLNSEPVSAQPESLAYRAGKFLRRYRLQVATGTLVTAAVLMGTVAALWQARAAARAAEQERVARNAALAQTETAQAVKNFLVDLFSSNDVNLRTAEQRRATSAEQLLQEGARRVNAGFQDQPAVRAELQGVVGRLLYDLRLLEAAAPAMQERAEYLDRTNASPAERAAAWLAVSRLRHSQSDDVRSEEALKRAMAAGANAQTAEDWKSYWAAVGEYGSFLDVRDRPAEALPHLKRAMEGLRQVAPHSPEFALTLESYGGLLNDQGQTEGLPLLLQALALWETLHKDQPVDLARVHIRYSSHLMGTDNVRAERLARQGFQAMRQYAGADHPQTGRGALRLAQLVVQRGEPQEARMLLEGLLATIDASPRQFSKDIASQTYRFLGEASVDEGRLAEARQWAVKYQASAPSPVDQALAHILMGKVSAESGDYREALVELQKAQAIFAENTPPDHPLFARLRVLEGEPMRHTGQVEAARASLRSVVDREGNPTLQEAVDSARISLARMALDAKEPAEALAWVKPVYERFAQMPAEQKGRVREIRIVVPYALALISIGSVQEARPLVTRAVTLAEPLYPHGPLRLETNALAIRLAVADGRTDAARTQLQLARAALGREARIAPHYLRTLDAAGRSIHELKP